MKEIANYPEVKKWLAGKTKGSQRQYLMSLNIYADFRGLNPEELIDEIEADRKKERRERGQVEYILKEFYTWLTEERYKKVGGYKPRKTDEQGVSPKRAHSILGAIRGFYRANGYPIVLKLPRPTTMKKNNKMQLRAEDVKQLVDHAPTIRDKAVILMLFQSGMDVSTLCSLNYGDVAKGLEKGECPLPIRVIRKKENIEYTTFLAQDGIEALQAYLNKRQQRNHKLTLQSPLFVKERMRNGDERLTPLLIEKVLREVAVLSGVVTQDEMDQADMNPARPHALRAAFSTIMKLQGVNNEIVEYWLGHAIPYEAAYFIPPQEELQRIYAQNMEPLSINRAVESVKELERRTNQEMGAILRENRNLSKQVDLLEAQLADLKQSQQFQMGSDLLEVLKNPQYAKKVREALEQADE